MKFIPSTLFFFIDVVSNAKALTIAPIIETMAIRAGRVSSNVLKSFSFLRAPARIETAIEMEIIAPADKANDPAFEGSSFILFIIFKTPTTSPRSKLTAPIPYRAFPSSIVDSSQIDPASIATEPAILRSVFALSSFW